MDEREKLVGILMERATDGPEDLQFLLETVLDRVTDAAIDELLRLLA